MVASFISAVSFMPAKAPAASLAAPASLDIEVEDLSPSLATSANDLLVLRDSAARPPEASSADLLLFVKRSRDDEARSIPSTPSTLKPSAAASIYHLT